MRIFHLIPYVPHPSGGIKVHFQCVELEKELGYESYIVYPDDEEGIAPTWFSHQIEPIRMSDMRKIANRQHDLAIGWEQNDEELYHTLFKHKVMYVQGEVFISRSKDYHGLDIWFSSKFNQKMLPQFEHHRAFFVSPFIDQTQFTFDPKNENRSVRLLIQERKGGREAYLSLQAAKTFDYRLTEFLATRMKFTRDMSEYQFVRELQKTEYFFAHSYPEGLGLVPLEAMACGAIVVGFTGGGGTDYMEYGENCYVVNDGDYDRLASVLRSLIGMNQLDKDLVRFCALRTVAQYSRERTKQQLQEALSIY